MGWREMSLMWEKSMSKQNIYLINYKRGDYHLQLVFPSYKSLNGDMGYYWDLGMSLSAGKFSVFDLRISLLFGWVELTKYKKKGGDIHGNEKENENG